MLDQITYNGAGIFIIVFSFIFLCMWNVTVGVVTYKSGKEGWP